MTFDDTLIVDHIKNTHGTDLLSEREKHLIGLAVTMTRGCQVCTRNRIEKARGIGISDDELNALVAVTAAVNSGVTGATARVAFGVLEQETSEDCGDVCSPTPK
jgi:AhpD family alkylhydroperoxidase